MKVSLNWIRDFLDIHKTPDEIADILTSLGLETEGWETVKPSAVDLDKVLTGLVVACERIPDTDHLSATQVDVGDGIIRSIVCGAPNVAAGQKVLVALPGAQVFSKDGTMFAIAERKVRGVASQGMICAQDELGLGHDHSGIMVLPADTPIGITAATLLQQEADTVIEIGLTPNRADATNHAGVAKDLLAWLRVHEQPAAQLRPRNVPVVTGTGVTPLQIQVLNTEACPRYCGVVVSDIQVKESPDWLKNRLTAIGQRPINNVVDITNYVRAEMGQPLHAFDLSKIGGNAILVKNLPEGTVFKGLDGVDRKLLAEDLMICDGNSTPMCIGGVFGGAESGVTDGTTAIFLESAFFHPRSIRRSMIKHSLRTDAAWTFEKGVDPNGCRLALDRAVQLLEELAGGRVSSAVVDIYPTPVQPVKIEVAYSRINGLIGENLSKDRIKGILKALDIGIAAEKDDTLTVLVPTNKPDVLREADITEEILRVHGLDNVPIPTRIRTSMEISPRPNPDAVRNTISEFLMANGFNEAMGMSLSNSAYYTGEQAFMSIPVEQLAFVHNTANQGLDCMRPSLLPGLLEAVRYNQNRQNADLRLFESGKMYRRTTGDEKSGLIEGFRETARLAVLLTGQHTPESWHPVAKAKVDFYTLKSYVNNLLARLGISGYQETPLSEMPFQYALKYHRGPRELVTFGAIQPALLRKMDIKNAVFYADFHFEHVLDALKNQQITYSETGKFPTVRRDLALILDRATAFGDIRQLANKTAKKLLKDINLFDVFEDENRVGAGKKSYAVSFIFEDPEKTLQDKDIDALMNQLQTAFETKLGAEIRGAKNS
jgi:phenylalanyl-tRNA synthetase beta chain